MQLSTADPEADLPFFDPGLDVDLVLWNNADERGMTNRLRGLCRGRPRVLATLRDGESAALWELVPQRTELGEVSPQTLVQAILETAAGQP